MNGERPGRGAYADYAALREPWGNYLIARFQRGEPNAEGVHLLTVHKAQGREFVAVAVVGMNDGQFPDFQATDEESILDELRCFYVAATRASRVLLLTRAMIRPTRYGERHTKPSRFLGFASN